MEATVEREGKIVLISDDEGIIQNTGTMTASAIEDGASGGEIEMRGSKVGVRYSPGKNGDTDPKYH